MKTFLKIALFISIISFTNCTNLDETVYSDIVTNNFIQNKSDVYALSIRPFNHAFWTLTKLAEIQENTADQWVTPTRLTLWSNGGLSVRSHQHEWTWDDSYIDQTWEANWAGIVQVNNVLDILGGLDFAKYEMTQAEYDDLIWENRVLRSWYYIRLLDIYRNLPIYLSVKDASINIETQVSPQQTFDMIKSELVMALEKLPKKSSLGGNGIKQERWNQAGVASLLVRLLLNSEKWTGVDRYAECAQYAQKIIDGVYGPYKLDDVWDKPFKWNNNTSDEIIYAFASNVNYSYSHYTGELYWWALPCGQIASNYFGFTLKGDPNFRYGLQPGLDVDGNEYTYQLGKPVRKFQKYPTDYRLKLYKNLGNGEREGMFLFGYIPSIKGGFLKQSNGTDDLYLRDQVGYFMNAAPNEIIADKESSVAHADDNSGWRMVKYPFYPDTDGTKIFEADFAEIRLAEIYYSLAECKFRKGDVPGAAVLLNTVRKRNYPVSAYPTTLYQPEGNVVLNENELLDEWGREFLGELRRRTDLCRWNKFKEPWWDKTNSDSYRDIMPISRTAISANPNLKQNQGYNF